MDVITKESMGCTLGLHLGGKCNPKRKMDAGGCSRVAHICNRFKWLLPKEKCNHIGMVAVKRIGIKKGIIIN